MNAAPPPEDTPIWRYMDLAAFVQMLSSGFLWFKKLARFDDPHEGFGVAILPDGHPRDPDPKCPADTDSSGVTTQVSMSQMFSHLRRRSATDFENAPERLYVNSWCTATESMAMWEIYGSKCSGVAVKSSIGRYKRAVSFDVDENHYGFGSINYHDEAGLREYTEIDLRQDIPLPGPALWRKMIDVAFHKRICYQHENEWRAVLYQDSRPEVNGIDVNCDAHELIESVYVGPRSEPFMLDVVKSATEKFGLQTAVDRSSLLSPPKRFAV